MSTHTQAAGLDRVIAVINGKGGTLKTSVVSSLGALAAEAGWNVLLVDFDVQGNLSEDLGQGATTDNGQHHLDVVPNAKAYSPQPSGRDRLDLIHGGPKLHDLHAMMQARQTRDPNWLHAFANSLAGVVDDYDLVLIDCPPGNEVLQTLALVASRFALVPTRSDASSRKGLREVADRFAAVRPYNGELELLGVVRVGISSAGKKIRDEVRRDIEEDLAGPDGAPIAPVLQTCIRYAEAPAVSVRKLGRLPHELEPELANQRKAKFAHLAERRKAKKRTKGRGSAEPARDADVWLAPSTTGLAQDYAELAQEVLDLLAAAEESAEAAAGGEGATA